MAADVVKDHKWVAFMVGLGIIFALAIPVFLAGPADANHPSGTCLDVEPEEDTNPVGTVHSVTATLRDPAPTDTSCDAGPVQPAGSTVKISFEITGPNDTDGNTPDTPDRSCLILTGQTSCVMEYLGTATGTDTIRGWIDHDAGSPPQQCGSAPCVTEADMAEGRNEDTAPGTGCTGMGTTESLPEPDCTDVVEKTWIHGEPDTLDCDDANGPDTERETNPHASGARSNEVYTCVVADEFGNPTTETTVTVQGEHKDFVNDPENPDEVSYERPDYQCQTAGTKAEVDEPTRFRGGCRITVTQADAETGTTQICFWIESYTFQGGTPVNNSGATLCANETTEEAQLQNGSDTGNDEADQVEKTWEQARASSVDAEPETDTNPVGTNHTIHAFVYEQFGSPFQGNTQVNFEFFQGSPADTDGNTPNSPDRTCTTNNSNTCSITYTSQNPGTDLVCVWVGATPNMQGTNTTGTCDGEGLNDPDDAPSQTNPPTGDAPEPANDDQDVVQKTWQDPNAASRLDCEPETDANPTGTSHTVTCVARNESNSTVAQTQIDAEATGANDPDNSDTPTTPDFSCTTGSDGVCSFTHGPAGTGTTTQPGLTTYRAWIDSDNNNNSVEADPGEGQDQASTPGERAEPDDTDVVTKNWQGPTPSPTGSASPSPTPTPTGTATASPSPTGTETPPPPPECNDGRDNDGDGEIDYPNDPGCESASDNDESDGPQQEFGGDRGQSVESGPCAGFTTGSVNARAGGGFVIVGTNGADALQGSEEGDLICGLGGADTINGAGGADEIYGNAGRDGINGDDGNDSLFGNLGKDVMIGGDGRDTLRGGQQNDNLSGGADNDTLLGQGGWDTLKGNAGDDTFVGAGGNDIIQGGGGADVARGNSGDDVLKGFSGADTLRGGGGNDIIRGSAGNDTLRGGSGDDVLNGGAGNDSCRGGSGNNVIRRCE